MKLECKVCTRDLELCIGVDISLCVNAEGVICDSCRDGNYYCIACNEEVGEAEASGCTNCQYE